MTKNVQMIKLTTGENLISEVIGAFKVTEQVTNNDGSFGVYEHFVLRLRMPAVLTVQPQPNGKHGVGLAPFNPFSEEDDFDLEVVTIQGRATANKQLVDQYIRIVTVEQSGIILPPSGIIAG